MKSMQWFAVLLLTALCLAVTVSAERTLPLVVDDADILTENEESRLLSHLEAVSEELSCEIAVVTISSLNGKYVQDYADDYYDNNGYGYGTGDDGVLLLLAMDEREWAITTYGIPMYALSDRALYYMEEQMLPYLSGGNYYEGFVTFAAGCESYIRSYLTLAESDKDDPWVSFVEDPDYEDDYDYDDRTSFDVKGTLFVAVGIGVVIALVVVNSMKAKLTSVRSRGEANAYIRAGSFALRHRSDVFLYRNISRIRRDTDHHTGGSRSGGGSRSSSHRSSSGRSHGGRSGRF